MKVGVTSGTLAGFDTERGQWRAIGEPWDDDLLAFLGGGGTAVEQAQQAMRGSAPVVAAPAGLPFQPSSLRDFSLWEAHMVAAGRALVAEFAPAPLAALMTGFEAVTRQTFPPLRQRARFHQLPGFYFGNHLSIVGDHETVPWPSYSKAVDFELELGVVIATPVRDCDAEQGRAAIGGFVVLNDCSARDTQWQDLRGSSLGGMVKAKSFGSAISSVVVTADELIDDWQSISGRVLVNGEVWCTGTAAGPAHDLGAMVARAADSENLEAGALLGTGTLPGCCGLELRRFLKPGDQVTCELDGVGSVTTTYGQAP